MQYRTVRVGSALEETDISVKLVSDRRHFEDKIRVEVIEVNEEENGFEKVR